MIDEPGFFYEGGGRRAAIDALFEGIHRDDAVILLVGPSGAGRTELLDRFCFEVDPDVLAVGLATGDILMSAEQCFLALCDDLGAPESDVEMDADARDRLLNVLSEIRAAGRVPVILIDDAHELGEDARDGVISVCREAVVPLVLAGDATLQPLLGDDVVSATVALRAFTEDETEDFVAGWLAIADEDELPSHRAMARLHRQAGGLPGRLVDLLDAGGTGRTSLLPAGFPVWHLAFTVAAIFLLLWLLVHAEPEPVVPAVVESAEIPVTLPAPDQAGVSGSQGVVPETRLSTAAVPQQIVANMASPEEPVTPVAAPAVAQGAGVSTRPSTAAHEPVPVPAPVREPQKAVRRFSADEDALMKEKASRYTLQLFASFNEDAVRQFRSRHPGMVVRTFRTSREDLPWYVAVTGVYRNKDEARASVAKLSADLQKLKPWPRSLQGIQDELRRRKD